MPHKSKILYTQFIMYLFVGGVSFIVELGAFKIMLFTQVALIAASAVSFLIGNIANYFISLKVAFVGGRFSLCGELLRLSIIVLIGLALNTLIVVGLVLDFDIMPSVAKILSLPIVLLWNFIGRSFLVFQRNQLPPAIASTFVNWD